MHAHKTINNIFLLYNCQLLIICFTPHCGGPLLRQSRRELQKPQHPTDWQGADICHTSRDARATELERGVRHHQPRLRHPRPLVPHTLPNRLCDLFNHKSRPPSQSRLNACHPGRRNGTQSSFHPLGAQYGNAGLQHLLQRQPRPAPTTSWHRQRHIITSQTQAAPRVYRIQYAGYAHPSLQDVRYHFERWLNSERQVFPWALIAHCPHRGCLATNWQRGCVRRRRLHAIFKQASRGQCVPACVQHKHFRSGLLGME